MKLLHTADWHIGQLFHGYERKKEHLFFFEWLKRIIRERQADVLLIAGDIFDSPNPSAESQKLYYHFLRELTSENPGLQTVIIAGNHDSAARLEAPNPLLEEINISVKGTIKHLSGGGIDFGDLLVPLKKNGEIFAWCMTVPYLRQGDHPDAETYSKGVSAMYEKIYEELEENGNELPVIAMGHLQATGSSVSENDRSERTIIGGLECVAPEAFDKKKIVYTALGHLHKSQYVSGRENLRYSGSPLPMSFAEKNYKQGIQLIELSKNGLERIEKIEFDTPVKLLSLPQEPKPLDQVLEVIAGLPDGEPDDSSPYLELKVLITGPEPSLRNQIEDALKNKKVRLASAVPFRIKAEAHAGTISYEEMKAIHPLNIAEDVFFNKYGNSMPDNIKLLLQNVIREVET
ncbi:MAG: exonuclease SbcCD subunit D [Bacteroidales bacterium]|nr:exonuclease SbcCD subunit D [Bacteroidales bacterium]